MGQLVRNRYEDRQEAEGNSLLILVNGIAILLLIAILIRKEVEGLNRIAEEKTEGRKEGMESFDVLRVAFSKWIASTPRYETFPYISATSRHLLWPKFHDAQPSVLCGGTSHS